MIELKNEKHSFHLLLQAFFLFVLEYVVPWVLHGIRTLQLKSSAAHSLCSSPIQALFQFSHGFTHPSALEDLLNPHSPYYVHSSENPSISLVSSLLDPTNYNSWCRSMSIALSAKNKLEFIDGSLPPPVPNHALHTVWKRSNNMMVSWLIHSVSPLIRQSILWLDNVIDI